MPAWISVDDRLPRSDLPVLLWGDRLDEADHPLLGRLCGCHGEWVLDLYEYATTEAEDSEEHTERVLGRVTHWLEWEPVPAEGTHD